MALTGYLKFCIQHFFILVVTTIIYGTKRCEIQVAYAIGVAEPVSVFVNTFNTNRCDESKIEEAVREIFDLRPAAIIETHDLLKPIYEKTAAYGHFGRDWMPWERTDKIDSIKKYCNL